MSHGSDLQETIELLHRKIPCRKSQIDLLLSLLGEKTQCTCCSIFVNGHTSTGKSLVVNSIMMKLQLPHASVNCVEFYVPRLLFETILNQISGVTPCSSNNFTCFVRCDNMSDFVRHLPQAVEHRKATKETVYIILDNAQKLRDMDNNILPAFLRLQELSKTKVCVILISGLVWEKFRFGTGFYEPFPVHFPNYTKAELIEILNLDCPPEHSVEFYCNFVNLLLSVFHQASRDLSELRHLALINFEKYCEPVKSGDAQPSDVRKLWRNIEPHFKKALQTVYLREVSSAQWEKMQQQHNSSGDNSTGSLVKTDLMSTPTVELPFYSKYLLVAAYLASYNPAKVDRKFFMKHHGKIKKTNRVSKMTERVTNHLLGPKPFLLDRLMAIFYSIVEDKVAPRALIFSQIASLVSLHLLTHVGSDDVLQMPKYKCVASLEFTRNIARTINFDILRYLYDFI